MSVHQINTLGVAFLIPTTVNRVKAFLKFFNVIRLWYKNVSINTLVNPSAVCFHNWTGELATEHGMILSADRVKHLWNDREKNVKSRLRSKTNNNLKQVSSNSLFVQSAKRLCSLSPVLLCCLPNFIPRQNALFE